MPRSMMMPATRTRTRTLTLTAAAAVSMAVLAAALALATDALAAPDAPADTHAGHPARDLAKKPTSPNYAVVGTQFAAVSLGTMFTCGVTLGGDGYCWGLNAQAQVSGDGKPSVWSAGQFAKVGVSRLVSVTAGDSHVCFLDAASRVYCQGSNTNGETSPSNICGDCSTKITQYPSVSAKEIYAGRSYTCFLQTDSSLACVGSNLFGCVGNGAFMSPTSSPVVVMRGVSTASASFSHICAVTLAGAVSCWGFQNHLQILGGPPIGVFSKPLAFAGHSASAVSSGLWHTCLIESSGAVGCGGNNGYNQLGQPSSTTDVAYTSVQGLAGANVRTLVSGFYYSVALLGDGTMATWGQDVGQTGLRAGTNTGLSGVTKIQQGSAKAKAVAAGMSHFCFIEASTSVLFCAGDGVYGDLGGVSTSLESFVAVNIPGVSGAGGPPTKPTAPPPTKAPPPTAPPTAPTAPTAPSPTPLAPTKAPAHKPHKHGKPTKHRKTPTSLPTTAPTLAPSRAPSRAPTKRPVRKPSAPTRKG